MLSHRLSLELVRRLRLSGCYRNIQYFGCRAIERWPCWAYMGDRDNRVLGGLGFRDSNYPDKRISNGK